MVETLIVQGVSEVFAVPGESYLATLDALHGARGRIALRTCRFEAGAVHMAEAVGKLTGRPAAAMVTRGPGACHAAIGVHVAFQDSTPLLLFVGQIPHAERDRESFQEIDYRRFFSPIAKWVTEIDDPARVPELLAHAVDVAVSGRPGPVVIALPEEMQAARARAAIPGPARVAPAHPDPAALAELRRLLAAARRPLAILGGGGWSLPARAAIAAFLAANAVPTTVAFRRQSLFDGTSPLYAGDLGVGADPALVAAAREADLVLAIGTRLGEAVSQRYTLPGPDQTLIHVHAEPSEIGRVFRPALGIVAAPEPFARAAAALPPLEPATLARWSAWRARLRGLREAGRAASYPGPLDLAEVMRSLASLLAPDAILTTDAGNFAGWPARFLEIGAAQEFLGPTNGAMGYAVPAAVGAALANPGREVVAFVGDGGFTMTGSELATARHHGAAPIVLVFNNNMFGTIRMHQERAYPGHVSATDLTNPDFAALARAFGGHGESVRETAEFAPAFLRARACRLPAVIELAADPAQITTRARLAG